MSILMVLVLVNDINLD